MLIKQITIALLGLSLLSCGGPSEETSKEAPKEKASRHSAVIEPAEDKDAEEKAVEDGVAEYLKVLKPGLEGACVEDMSNQGAPIAEVGNFCSCVMDEVFADPTLNTDIEELITYCGADDECREALLRSAFGNRLPKAATCEKNTDLTIDALYE